MNEVQKTFLKFNFVYPKPQKSIHSGAFFIEEIYILIDIYNTPL